MRGIATHDALTLATMRQIEHTHREICFTTKAAYVKALELDRKAAKHGIAPAFDLGAMYLAKAKKKGDPAQIAFADEVYHVMQCMEFFCPDALYVLSD